jgi:hypothetical protein
MFSHASHQIDAVRLWGQVSILTEQRPLLILPERACGFVTATKYAGEPG